MPKAKSLRLKEGINIFNLKTLKGKNILARIHVTMDGDNIMINPELRMGKSISIQ